MPYMRGSRAALLGRLMVSAAAVLPIDAAGSGGTLAAYGLRALSRSYAASLGPLVDVRRSSDNSTATIRCLANGSLDVATLLAFVGSGTGYVSKWYDQGPYAYHGTQATAASQPIIVSAGALITQNGLPSISYNGSSQYFNTTVPATAFTTTSYLNTVVNMNAVASGQGQRILETRTGGGDYHESIAFGVNSAGTTGSVAYDYCINATAYNFGGNNTVSWATNYILEMVYGPSAQYSMANGISGTVNNCAIGPSPANVGAPMKIGYDIYQAGSWFGGSIGEVVLLMGSNNRGTVHANQKSYWGFG